MNPRVAHHITNQPVTVTECLKKHFRLTGERVHELMTLGAIYLDKKRVFADRELPKGAYLRIHLQPKRFPVDDVDWTKVVLHTTKDFIVVDKPAGIPVHATLDNQHDNVLHQLRLLTGHHLLVTQRLDTPVAGLLVIARTADFQRRFNQWLLERKVRKCYQALVTSAPAVGRLVHFMEPSERSPRRVGTDERPGWQRCELDVLAVRPAGERFEVDIDLLTGRTHQIRAQLGAVGAPIVGDRMYGSREPQFQITGRREALGLYATSLAWPGSVSFESRPFWAK